MTPFYNSNNYNHFRTNVKEVPSLCAVYPSRRKRNQVLPVSWAGYFDPGQQGLLSPVPVLVLCLLYFPAPGEHILRGVENFSPPFLCWPYRLLNGHLTFSWEQHDIGLVFFSLRKVNSKGVPHVGTKCCSYRFKTCKRQTPF